MKYFESEEEFKLYLDRLNALLKHDFEWKQTQARKDHEDMYDETIKKGDLHFTREYGTSFDVLRLSRLSMERLLFAVFTGNWTLEQYCDNQIQTQAEAFRKALNGM